MRIPRFIDGQKTTARMRNYFIARERLSEELSWSRIEDLKDLKRPVVLVNGSFDVLHSGHMKLIFAARKRAGTLVVAMDSDRRVRELKGSTRPIQLWSERATSLQYMPVDHLVEIDSNEEFLRLVEAIQPDLRVMGADYIGHRSRVPGIKTMYVRGTGMRTSYIVDRIKRGLNET